MPLSRRHPVLFGTLLTLSALAVAVLSFTLVLGLSVPHQVTGPVGSSTTTVGSNPTTKRAPTQPPTTTRPSTKKPTTKKPTSNKPTAGASSTKPKPKTDKDKAWDRLRGNPANKVSFPAKADCPTAKTNPTKLGQAAMKKWVTAMVKTCMTPLWAKTLSKAGVSLPAPKLVVVDGSWIDTPCGTVTQDDTAAFHCAGGLYFFRKELQRGWGSWGPWGMYYVLGHEYGHYVQYRTRVLQDRALLSEGRSTSQRNALTRRVELQASCMGGMLIASVAWVMPQWDYAYVAENIGGQTDATHGTTANQTYWAVRGMSSRTSTKCNTWTAKSHLS